MSDAHFSCLVCGGILHHLKQLIDVFSKQITVAWPSELTVEELRAAVTAGSPR